MAPAQPHLLTTAQSQSQVLGLLMHSFRRASTPVLCLLFYSLVWLTRGKEDSSKGRSFALYSAIHSLSLYLFVLFFVSLSNDNPFPMHGGAGVGWPNPYLMTMPPYYAAQLAQWYQTAQGQGG